jgi:PhzF family phenazine biosynthesis protein
MYKTKIYQVDAFADKLFTGNPAAVCILENWLSDEVLQAIASENNLAETAFIVPGVIGNEIRWFTPSVEVDLCGHATLASAFVFFNCLDYKKTSIIFHSPRSGELSVSQLDDYLMLDFPADTLKKIEINAEIEKCIGIKPVETWKGKSDFMAVLESERDVSRLLPDFEAISKLESRGLIVTAKGKDVDFVSRFFAPQSGINEDPVTGSAHTTLIPYWSEKLNKKQMHARQLSKRGGEIICRNKGERTLIGGKAKLYMVGEIYLP